MGSLWDHGLFAITRRQERVRLPINPAELAGLGHVPGEVNTEIEIPNKQEIRHPNCLLEAFITVQRLPDFIDQTRARLVGPPHRRPASQYVFYL